MNSQKPSPPNVREALREAGERFSRDRAIAFFLRGLLVILVAVPLVLLADVLFHFSDWLRLAGGLFLVLAGVAVVAVCLWIGVVVRPPALRLARLLESRNPALGSKLVNILQLQEEAELENRDPLTRSLAKRAVADAEKGLPLGELAPLAAEAGLRRKAGRVAGVFGFLALITLFGGPHVRNGWLRFLDPFGDHPPFSLTRLEILTPVAEQKVLYGDGFTVEVRASGHQPKELFLRAESPQGELNLPMTARGDGTFTARLENITSPLELTGHTRDDGARSHRRNLDLILTPQIGKTAVTLSPPTYTGLSEKNLPWRFSALQALEGTEMTFRLSSNRPLGTGSITLDTGEKPLRIPLVPDPADPQTATAVFKAEKSGRMSFSLVDSEGNPATETPTASLTVTRDQPPAVSVNEPSEDALIVEDFTIDALARASDDYGLASVRLHVAVNGNFAVPEEVVFEGKPTRSHEFKRLLDLGNLGAKPGDKITVYAEAIDTRPDPQLTRSSTRTLEVISEEDYKQRLREEADVALIAGKYEELLSRFESALEAQRQLAEELAELAEKAAQNPGDPKVAEELAEALEEQKKLNEELKKMAEEMENFGEGEPVYDFEKDLRERLAKQAEKIRESFQKNEADLEKAESDPSAPGQAQAAGEAAKEQHERLAGEAAEAEEGIRQPLEDLALLHELMKDFNLFKELTEAQGELAEESQAFENKLQLNAEDRLDLRELGARQREMAGRLEKLSRKLKHDAEAAAEKFPEAAASAEGLAEAIDEAPFPDMARGAARSMLGENGTAGHAQAENLHEEMERLFEEFGEEGQEAIGRGMDGPLGLMGGGKPGDKPGNSHGQMMASRNFRALPGEAQNGNGRNGLMAMSAQPDAPMMLGGETLLDGPIAAGLQMGSGPEGLSGAPTAALDPVEEAQPDSESARRTSTPRSEALLLNYEKIADAYFRRLTATSEP